APPLHSNLGVASPHRKLARCMAPKRREIACRCQLTNYAQCDGFHGVPHSTLSSTPSPKLGDCSPHAKFFLRLTRKRREIAFRFQQTNFTHYGGLSRGATPDPQLYPSPQIGGRFPPC